MRRPLIRLAATAVLLPALAACSSGDANSPSTSASAPSGGTGSGEMVGVTLQEWAVVPETTTIPAGSVTFDISNTGPEDEHEFVVVRTDTPAGDLPTADTGAVDEDASGLEVVDEVEELPVGGTESLTVNLEAGHYVLLCNIYSAEENEAHYQMGMRTDITVE